MAHEEDDDDEDVTINILEPVKDTKGYRKELRDPQNLTFEEEFYVLYFALFSMAKKWHEAVSLFERGKIEEAETLRMESLDGMKIASFLASKVDHGKLEEDGLIGEIPEGHIFYPQNILDSDKLSWGSQVSQIIAKDPLLRQIWAIRLRELSYLAKEDFERCGRLEARLGDIKPEAYYLFIRKTEAESRLARIYEEGMEAFHQKFDEQWEDGELLEESAIDAFFEKFDNDEHLSLTSAVEYLEQVTQGVRNEFAEKFPNGSGLKGTARSNADSEVRQLLELLASDDCGNPNCPIHGKSKVIDIFSNRDVKTPPIVPTLSKPQQPSAPALPAPAGNAETKEENTSMSTQKKSDEKKEDELKFSNVSVQFVADPKLKHIQLPNGMTLKEARHWLKVIEDEETRAFRFEYKFRKWSPLDAMWALYQALVRLHGFAHVADFQTWFGPVPPTMVTIETDFGKTQQIPWGPIQVNQFSAPLEPRIVLVEGHLTLQISAVIRNNERGRADQLVKAAEEMLESGSIYRGKAIEADFEMVSPEDFRFDQHKAPKFWDTSKTKIEELILSEHVARLVKTNIWTPIRKTEEARLHKIPLRRTTLLAGSYGVGKTLAANATAKIAQDNGWTFLYLRKLDQLKSALYFAKQYQPCVIFAEDINRITSGKRDEEMDELFNTIDGIDRKNDEVMLVFTTNNIEEIHPGMIRPGRIDTVITVTPPDADAVQRLVRLYGRGLIEENANLAAVGEKLKGQIPAIIREAVERSKLAAIEDNDGGQLVVRAEHLETAADQMLIHAEFLREPAEAKPDIEILGQAIGGALAVGMKYGVIPDNVEAHVQAEGKGKLISDGVQVMLDRAGRPVEHRNHE